MLRRLGAEALGSAMLSGAVVGSGIMADAMTADAGLALIGNTGATAAILFVIITALGPVSGGHFNPAVTLVMVLRREIGARPAVLYALVQIGGCVFGAMLAHAMFELPLIQEAQTVRAGGAQILSEAVATFALIFAIIGVSRWRPQAVPAAVALVIAAGYWWTASTSFANPAITVARALSDTFAGLRPIDAPGLIAGQFAGAIVALFVCAALFPKPARQNELPKE